MFLFVLGERCEHKKLYCNQTGSNRCSNNSQCSIDYTTKNGFICSCDQGMCTVELKHFIRTKGYVRVTCTNYRSLLQGSIKEGTKISFWFWRFFELIDLICWFSYILYFPVVLLSSVCCTSPVLEHHFAVITKLCYIKLLVILYYKS